MTKQPSNRPPTFVAALRQAIQRKHKQDAAQKKAPSDASLSDEDLKALESSQVHEAMEGRR